MVSKDFIVDSSSSVVHDQKCADKVLVCVSSLMGCFRKSSEEIVLTDTLVAFVKMMGEVIGRFLDVITYTIISAFI